MAARELPLAPIVAKAEESLEQLAAAINADHEAGEGATRRGLEHFRDAGEKLIRAKKHPKITHGKWLLWLKKNFSFTDRRARHYMQLAREWDGKSEVTSDLMERWRHISGNAADEEEPPREGEFVTLSQWKAMKAPEQKAVLLPENFDKRFNDQAENENIEWAHWSWNPITGCEHNCPYCYARDIAERFYPSKFEPTIWPDRLFAPENHPLPEARIAEETAKGTPTGAARAMALGNVFTCSMADLFGRWVPREWIEAVLDRVRAAPQWNFLFLTKFPVRMAEFDFPENAWVGTSVDCQARVANAERSFRKVKAAVKWLSCEPLIEPLVFKDLGAFQWVVIGGASRSTQTPEWVPPDRWVTDLKSEAYRLGVKVYEKSNVRKDRTRQYPGIDGAEAEEAPEALQYLAKVEKAS